MSTPGPVTRQRSAAKMTSTNDQSRIERPEENAPLLGGPGDATQPKDNALGQNLILGTAPLAQLGIWILTGIVWGSIFSKPEKLMLFSAHPLLNSFGILLSVQAILLLQPTHTQSQKIKGTYAHAALNDLGLFSLIAAAIIIYYNKAAHNGAHFESAHAKLGLITYILLIVQVVVGGSAFFVPKAFGSVARAKSLYKYHRASGYAILILSFATVALATQTDTNKNVLHINLWAVIVAAVITLIGIVPRIKLSKLGF